MTKQEFLNGTEFKIYGSNASFKLDSGGGCIVEVARTKEGKYLFSSHVMNTDGIGSKRVSLYSFVMGKRITRTLYFKDMMACEWNDDDNASENKID